ncbi:MAG: leucyl aminopeptidase [Rhizobiaceae bacterium]|nr:leucyl aminopeptidase [Rhizobiaceae bacterium]
MAKTPSISFTNLAVPIKGAVVVLMPQGAKLPADVDKIDDSGRIARALKVAQFTGKHLTSVNIISPNEKLERLIILGCGDIAAADEHALMKIGGKIKAICAKVQQVTVLAYGDDKKKISGENFAFIAMGAKLRSYDFDDYKTKTKKPSKTTKIIFASKVSTAARKKWKELDGIADGVNVARDLVNQPPNKLGAVEFAREAQKLSKLGVKVEVLGEKEMKALKMDALLGVNQGSVRPPRLVVMKWNGAVNTKAQPIAFVGKGVVFDTGGISIKPAGGMEDMKGDMGGAAAVTGLMHALASRKAKANVIGIIGLVENMPDGNAQRPGDIVKSMSGQTIEIINTDAEGRLVLADALWYCQKKYKPKFMINLATLTGAVLVALGNHHAGLFSNNDELADNISTAGIDTAEKVWRLPLGPEYDKLIDSKNADMKNTGGRYAGSITAAQFLQRFVNDVPWAHLDVAGTAMGSPKHEYNQSWGSGFGVRLLNQLVANKYE